MASRYEFLLDMIRNKTAKVCIVGMGYIGLPTALFFARAGFQVRGVDTNEPLVNKLKNMQIPIKEDGLESLATEYLESIELDTTYETAKECDAFVLCLPTPIDSIRKTNVSYLEHAVRTIAKLVSQPPLVLVESTVPVGTTERLVDLFRRHTYLQGEDTCWFAHCPERVQPGNIVREMKEGHRLVGGITSGGTTLATELLTAVYGADKIHSTTAKISEFVKLVENTYRDTCIAYANQIAVISSAMGIDVNEVIDLANLHPRVNILHPGLGVGGYCLPKDGWILIESVEEYNSKAPMVSLARSINDGMPHYVLDRIIETVQDLHDPPTIALLGIAYKPNINDIRESSSLRLKVLLEEKGYECIVYDPIVYRDHAQGSPYSIESVIQKAKVIVISTAHDQILDKLRTIDLTEKIVVDPWSVFKDQKETCNTYVGLSIKYKKSD